MKPRRTISVYVLLVGILGLSIAGGVLTFQIFSAASKSQLTPEQSKAIRPIDGSISDDIITNLETRTIITDAQINLLEPVPLGNPTPTPIPTLLPTPELTPEATEATESAEQIIES